MASSCSAFQVNGSLQRPSISHSFEHLKNSFSSTISPFLKELQQISMRIDVSKTIKNTSGRLLDAFVDSSFQFVDQPLLPSQRNFAPVEEIGEAVQVASIEGKIPVDFPDGIYIRNGPNPLFGGLKSTVSMFGTSSHTWIEGEGMLHALYFNKDTNGNWTVSYKNRYIETETFNMEKQRKKPSFIPAIEGDSPAILAAYLINMVVDGKKLSHKVDLKFNRSSLCHEIGVTQKYNVIMDFPLTLDIERLVRGGPLIKYDKEGYARIGVMPRYGDADSIMWFEVEPHCTFHILNCFEDGDEVVVRGCRALGSIIPGPDLGHNKFEWFARGFKPIVSIEEDAGSLSEDGLFFSRTYEWRLNMATGDIKERNLTGTNFSMDFPMIHEHFTGVKNKYGYTQVIDSLASSSCGMAKFGRIAKLYFEEPETRLSKSERQSEDLIKVEYHKFEGNQFCSGASFVPKHGGLEEDDGWIISFVHNEETNISQVHIIDTKKFEDQLERKKDSSLQDMASSCFAFHVNGSVNRQSISQSFDHLKTSLSSSVTPFLKELQRNPMRMDVSKTMKQTTGRVLDAFVESLFQFVDQPWLPSQSNFAPVEEIGEAVQITTIEGKIPADLPEGIYIRNGSNPLFGDLKSTVSIFGRSSHVWVEGEGMLHALYFTEDTNGNWTVSYKNKYVESETFKLERQRNRPSFLPTVEGDSPAILAAYILNMVVPVIKPADCSLYLGFFQLRFGTVTKHISNTNIFGHSGKFYSIAENYIPQEIDIFTLETYNDWDINGAWDRPFTSHPKRDPATGELVIMGADAKKPFFVLGVISADGKKLSHKVDLKFNRSTLSHEIGVTQKYNVIMDYPFTVEIERVVRGGPLIKFNKEGYARIGVMPRYGDADSVMWFEVESHCTFHILNCFEDGDEVVVRGCRALGSIIPGPDLGHNKFEWFARGFKPIVSDAGSLSEDGLFFTRIYEWTLNMATGEVKERFLTGTNFSMDFPTMDEKFTGVKNKYGYTQVVDSIASSSSGNKTHLSEKTLFSIALLLSDYLLKLKLLVEITIQGMAKYGSLAKLYFEEPDTRLSVTKGISEELIKVEYHKFEENHFCSGAVFVSKHGAHEEDDGYIVSFVHDEETNVSQVHVIDTKKFSSEPVAKITLPQRVPYGFHGTYIEIPTQKINKV
ncbi:hypothetical protein HHK36_014161 [Tetracentron sinense]|uniref:Uncharacterized protein n=1 Tax=Tetracentron sinense TaxID=13715 RepID=A0A835DEY0_TETSI|nr:hypothetical protein HHK36_014161 [Tetracentron sinense]